MTDRCRAAWQSDLLQLTLHGKPTVPVYWLLPGFKPEWVAIAAGTSADAHFSSPSVSVWEKTKPNWLFIPADVHLDEQPQKVLAAAGRSLSGVPKRSN